MDKELQQIISAFAKLRECEAGDEEVRAVVKRLWNYLGTKFPCDLEAFSNFADMYRQNDFKKNIDMISSEGTAEFIARAIEEFCYN